MTDKVKLKSVLEVAPCIGDYIVLHENNYVSFGPKEVFEGGYLMIAEPTVRASEEDADMERDIEALHLTAPRVTPEMIEALMAGVTYDVHHIPNTATTVATAIAANGFTLAIGMTANFNAEFGAKYAIEDAKTKARAQLWKLEGWRLKCQLANLDNIAKKCHEANRAYCAAMGDHSQLPWDDAPEWQRQSAVAGVEYHLHHTEATSSSSHENWMAHKLAEGWAFGPVKDPETKQHPCLVPFHELPAEQQAKDAIFKTIVDLELQRI